MMGSEHSNDQVTGVLELVKSEAPNTLRRINLKGTLVTMGRGVTNTVIWENLLQVSRKHAMMLYENQTWKLKDMSTNGLLVNGRKIPKDVLVDLHDSDVISFIPTGALQYKFKKINPIIPKNHIAKTEPSLSSTDSSPNFPHLQLVSASPIRPTTSSNFLTSPPKRKTYPEFNDSPGQSSERDRKRKRMQNVLGSHQIDLLDDEEELADIDEIPIFFDDSSPSELNDENINQNGLVELDSGNEDSDDIQSVKEKLKSCQARIRELEFQNKKLTDEKQDAVESLQRKVSNAKSESLVFQEELIKKLLEVLEHEFSCCICNEVFIQATVVDCGHTFCGYCISEWVKRKSECPNCRKSVQMQVKHTEMENFITKLHSLLSEDSQKRRQDIIQDRQREVEESKAQAATSARNPRSRNGLGMAEFSLHADRDRFVDFLAELQQINDMFVPNRRATHLGNVARPPPPPTLASVDRPDDLPGFNIADFRFEPSLMRGPRAAAAHQIAGGSSRRRSARISTARGGGSGVQQQAGGPPQQQISPSPEFAQQLADFVRAPRDILTVD